MAIRLPGLQELALKVGPFILPSANLTDKKPPYRFEEIDPNLKSQVDFVLNEPTGGREVSTLVDARGEKPIILRQGAIVI